MIHIKKEFTNMSRLFSQLAFAVVLLLVGCNHSKTTSSTVTQISAEHTSRPVLAAARKVVISDSTKSVSESSLSDTIVETDSGYVVYLHTETGKPFSGGTYPEEPILERISSNLYAITVSCGSPCRYVTYADRKNGRLSEPFFLPIPDTTFQKVIYSDVGTLFLADMFSKRVYCKIVDNFCGIASGEAVDSVDFSESTAHLFYSVNTESGDCSEKDTVLTYQQN